MAASGKSRLRSPFAQWKRHVIQLLSAVLYNLDFHGIATASLYTGPIKSICVPGLNCYSCPGAIGACPIGSLQVALVRADRSLPFYVVGLILAFGALFGRTICGWACPFGLIQGLLAKIPVRKVAKGRWSRALSWGKYAVLAVMCCALPPILKAATGVGVPAFCAYLCPQGLIEAGIPLLLGNPGMRIMMGPLFWWKVGVSAAVILACIVIYRPFCRFLCPLGALYSFFNRFALLRWTVDEAACTHCGACVALCPVDIREVSDRECIQCGRCAQVCPEQAIRFSTSGIILPENEVAKAAGSAETEK